MQNQSQNNNYIYTLEGQMYFWLYNNQTQLALQDDTLGELCLSDLNQAIDKMIWPLGPSGFAHLLPYQELGLEENSIESITLKAILKGKLTYSITTITAKCPLSDMQKEKIKTWMLGQFSDGFGEAFEQRPIISVDSPNKPSNPSDGVKQYSIFGHFWVPSATYNWVG